VCAQKHRCFVILAFGSKNDDVTSGHNSDWKCKGRCVRAFDTFGVFLCFVSHVLAYVCVCVCSCVCVRVSVCVCMWLRVEVSVFHHSCTWIPKYDVTFAENCVACRMQMESGGLTCWRLLW